MQFDSVAIWELLKEKKRLELESPKIDHPRIIRRLQRQSHLDTLFRFQCVEKGISFQIPSYSIGNTLYIRLEFRDGIPRNFSIHKSRG